MKKLILVKSVPDSYDDQDQELQHFVEFINNLVLDGRGIDKYSFHGDIHQMLDIKTNSYYFCQYLYLEIGSAPQSNFISMFRVSSWSKHYV